MSNTKTVRKHKRTPGKKNHTKRRKHKSGKKIFLKKESFFLLLILSLFLLFFYWSRFSQNKSIGSIPGNSYAIPVIDVSQWEGAINWKKVKNQGIQHAILKIGSGNYDGTGFHEDPLFKTNYVNAIQEGIHCGVYFFSYAVTENESKQEALHCLELLNKYEIDPDDLFFPVAFDIEYEKALNTGKRNCTNMTVAFCETMKEAGFEPMIYASASYFNTHLNYEQMKDYKIWVANYEASGPSFDKPYSMWQYSEDGVVDGVDDLCDMNYWYTNYIEVEDIELSKDKLTLSPGKTKTLNATLLPKNATNQRIHWKSSNENIIQILNPQTGEIKAVGTGSARITAETPNGIKKKIRITVK